MSSPINVKPNDILEKMRAVYLLAQRSNDTSTKNGAILCREGWNISKGYNHVLQPYSTNPESFKRPKKYGVTEHAERSALFWGAFNGVDIRGTTMVANWVACADCARAIVLSGVADVICHKECMMRTPPRWKESVNLGLDILDKHGVTVHYWSGKVGIENLNDGEIWLA